jgi:hypothetical protein
MFGACNRPLRFSPRALLKTTEAGQKSQIVAARHLPAGFVCHTSRYLIALPSSDTPLEGKQRDLGQVKNKSRVFGAPERGDKYFLQEISTKIRQIIREIP